MRTIIIAVGTLLVTLLSNYEIKAQDKLIRAVIPPVQVFLTNTKTTNLIFPFAIKSIDRGSREVLAQKAPGVENILQVKAANNQMQESNLTVITSDGALYSFNVTYNAMPAQLNITLGTSSQVTPSAAILQNNSDDNAQVQVTARELMSRNSDTGRPNASAGDIDLAVQGIYVQKELLYFKLRIRNNSSLKYDVEQLRFYIKDADQAKRTAVQEIELRAAYTAGNAETVSGRSSETLVLAFPKFSLSDQKWLGIQLSEKNGGRNLELKIKNKALVTAIPVK